MYAMQKDRAPKIYPDRVYFFQLMVRVGNTVVIVGKEGLTPYNYNELRRYIGHLLPDSAPGLLEIVTSVQKLNRLIDSMSLQVNGNELSAVLPIADNSLCKRKRP
jgi:hypothetical protein